MSTSEDIIQCKICHREFKTTQGLANHIARAHSISIADYYMKYINSSAGRCKTCGDKTNFHNLTKGYYMYCSRTCISNNPELKKQRIIRYLKTLREYPEIKQQRINNYKQTLEANPEIREKANKKCKETHRKNPNIAKDAARKTAKTMRNTPGKMEQRIKKYQETLKNNPEIVIKRSEKQKQTLKDPEVIERKSKAASIALREYYNKLKQNSDTAKYIVYLVSHHSLDIVKIGITNNINNRMHTLKKDFGSIEIIKTLDTVYSKAIKLESKLHDYFKDHCKVQPKGDGRTEWFNSCITEEAVKMLR